MISTFYFCTRKTASHWLMFRRACLFIDGWAGNLYNAGHTQTGQHIDFGPERDTGVLVEPRLIGRT